MSSIQQYYLNNRGNGSSDKNINEIEKTPIILKEIFDGFSYRIIMSVIGESKTVFQICEENKLPISSTYKKIKKLKNLGLLFVDRIIINEKGKKVLFYKSKIQSLQLILNKQQVELQVN